MNDLSFNGTMLPTSLKIICEKLIYNTKIKKIATSRILVLHNQILFRSISGIKMDKVLLKDDQLILKSLETQDVTEVYLSWLREDSVREFIVSTDHDLNSLKTYVQEKSDRPDTIFLGIYFEGKHIGNIKFEPIDMETQSAEMGILIGEKNLRGINLSKKIFDLSFQHMKTIGLKNITLGVHEDNLIALKAYLKYGFEILHEKSGIIKMKKSLL